MNPLSKAHLSTAGICISLAWLLSVLLQTLAVGNRANSAGDGFTNQFIIHIKGASIDVDELTTEAARYHLQYVEQIVPAVHVYRDTSLPQKSSKPKYFPELLSFFKYQLEIEQIPSHIHLHVDSEPVSNVSYDYPQRNARLMNLVCQPYCDMGVETAWAMGITGHGVVVGVVDVGVNTKLDEMAANINHELSYNFMDTNHNVEPIATTNENYRDYGDDMDHGNRCSGLIAAVKDNNLCSSGVAYNCSVAALKVFTMSDDAIKQGNLDVFSVASVAKANVHRLHKIHIYSNSWSPVYPFYSADLASQKAFKYGAMEGRHKKGSIYVFSTGSVGNGYANSIFTIAVGGLGVNGTRRSYTEPNACTLTSAYREGSKLNDTYLVTASFDTQPCTRDFKGTSASTAIVAGIVALALQANEDLTWRDVQHLIVNSSQHTGLQTSHEFRPNGAGKYFHDYFGFGLLRADEMVKNAKDWKPVNEQIVCETGPQTPPRNRRSYTKVKFVPVHCCSKPGICIHNLEHVVLAITFKTPDVRMVTMELKSPSQTKSYLIRKDRHRADSAHQEVITTNLTSVHFWGENPEGTWILRLIQADSGQGNPSINSAELTLYGTSMTSSTERAKIEPSINLAPALPTTDAVAMATATAATTATASVTVTIDGEIQTKDGADCETITIALIRLGVAAVSSLLFCLLCLFCHHGRRLVSMKVAYYVLKNRQEENIL